MHACAQCPLNHQEQECIHRKYRVRVVHDPDAQNLHRLRMPPVRYSPHFIYNILPKILSPIFQIPVTTFDPRIYFNMVPKYHIRPASSAQDDGKKILEFTDSQLPYLASIGSAEQWGSASVSVRDAAQQKYKRLVERSEEEQTWGTDWTKIFILDAEVDNDELSDDFRSLVTSHDQDSRHAVLPVAAMILEGRSSDYTRPVLPEQDALDPFLYVRYLVTDRRAGKLSQGSGQRLLEHADEVAGSLGVGRLCLDGWNGNDYLLVK